MLDASEGLGQSPLVGLPEPLWGFQSVSAEVTLTLLGALTVASRSCEG